MERQPLEVPDIPGWELKPMQPDLPAVQVRQVIWLRQLIIRGGVWPSGRSAGQWYDLKEDGQTKRDRPLGVNNASLSKWVRGVEPMSPESVERVCEAFNAFMRHVGRPQQALSRPEIQQAVQLAVDVQLDGDRARGRALKAVVAERDALRAQLAAATDAAARDEQRARAAETNCAELRTALAAAEAREGELVARCGAYEQGHTVLLQRLHRAETERDQAVLLSVELREEVQALTDRLNAIDVLTEAARTVTLSEEPPFGERAAPIELVEEGVAWDSRRDESLDDVVQGTRTEEELDGVFQQLADSGYLERRRLLRSIAEAWSDDDVYRLAVLLHGQALCGSETGPDLARQLMRRAGVRFFELGTRPSALMRQWAAFRNIRLDLQKALPALPQEAGPGDYNVFAFGDGVQI